MTAQSPPRVYEIPEGATIQRCRSARCQAAIAYITTDKGKKMPVTVATGVSHFVDCVDAAAFKRRGRALARIRTAGSGS